MVQKCRTLSKLKKNIFRNGFFKNKLSKNSKPNGFKKLYRSKSADRSLYYKPIGLSHLNRISKYLKRSINFWSKDRLIGTFGKYSENTKINVEYIEKFTMVINLGHYTLKGKKEPHMNEKRYPNNCLFDVLASQTGIHPNALRQAVIKEARKKSTGKLMKRRLSTLERFPIALAIRGGARYNGYTEDVAKRILDASQKGESHPDRKRGHPRGHASFPKATGPEDSVENYSKSGWKTGFLSRSDQDFVAHLTLKSSDAQDAMVVLNELGKNANKEAVTIRASYLPVDDDYIPKAQEWRDGKKQGEAGRIRDVVLVMKHFYEKYNDERADVCDNILLRENQRIIGDPRKFAYQFRKCQRYKALEGLSRQVERQGPAGLVHARALSKIVNRTIRVWRNGGVVRVFGRMDGRLAVDVEYRGSHWGLRDGREPPPVSRSLAANDCLYDAVGAQTGMPGAELRRWTAEQLRRDGRRALARACFSGSLMMGGARYNGNSPRDAGNVFDASQNGQCHPEGWRGHPRGHASYGGGGRSEDSVEGYSMSRWRSGFLSRDDQDLVGHHAFVTRSARDLMDRLNQGQFKVAEHIRRNEIDYDPLPMGQIWNRGERQGSPSNFRSVCLVGKHFLNMHNDAYADLFVVTFYPEL